MLLYLDPNAWRELEEKKESCTYLPIILFLCVMNVEQLHAVPPSPTLYLRLEGMILENDTGLRI